MGAEMQGYESGGLTPFLCGGCERGSCMGAEMQGYESGGPTPFLFFSFLFFVIPFPSARSDANVLSP